MVTFSKKQRSKVAQQKLRIRNSVWPNMDQTQLWLREQSDGWLSLPRAMPLIMRIMDRLAPKGQPISPTYLDLWCRTYDDAFIIVSKSREMAYYSGFSGERAQRTWATRMKILSDLGFISFKPGTSGSIHYVLLFNPYRVIEWLYKIQKVSDLDFNALRERMIEIGAKDLEESADPAPKRPIVELLSKKKAKAS